MKIEVYCDESHPDLLCSQNSKAKYLVIGGLWLESANRDEYKQEIHALRAKHGINTAEIKWSKVTANKLDFYKELLEWYVNQGEALRFRCVAINKDRVNLLHFHQNDSELAFYKFYYQMLHHWIHDFNEYIVFCDYKSNRKPDRLPVLRRALDNANITSQVSGMQAIKSSDSVLLQLTDILTGIASAKLNEQLSENGAKRELTRYFERRLGRQIGPTWPGYKKFNVFLMELKGDGW